MNLLDSDKVEKVVHISVRGNFDSCNCFLVASYYDKVDDVDYGSHGYR